MRLKPLVRLKESALRVWVAYMDNVRQLFLTFFEILLRLSTSVRWCHTQIQNCKRSANDFLVKSHLSKCSTTKEVNNVGTDSTNV